MSKNVELSMSTSTIMSRISKALSKAGESHAELIAKIIVENLATTEMGLSQLVLSFMGIEEKLDWVVGDECMVETKKLYSWQYDEAAMREKGMLYKDHIRGYIKNINMRKRRSITFEFDGIDSGKEKKISTDVLPSDIKRDLELILTRPDLADLL